MIDRLIERNQSVIPAADVKTEADYRKLLENTWDVDGISAYKVGLRLGLLMGLPKLVEITREYTDKPVIYDHQKAGNDIPEMGSEFADVCAKAGVNSVILFPFAGAETEENWIKASQDAGLHVIVGGHMTQKRFLWDEGGFIHDEAPHEIYKIAAENGVRDFVVPGNKPVYVSEYKQLLEEILGLDNFDFYSPGFVDQGGNISEYAQVAGNRWHAIVGRAIYAQIDQRAAAELQTSQIK